MTIPTLDKIIDRLHDAYGVPERPAITDPFELILYENVSYLVSDDHRWKAFENLKKKIGTRPEDIMAASPEMFESVVALAGSDKKGRVAKLVDSAEIAMKEFGGDLRGRLSMPFKNAVAALKKLPSVGEPGAEKILLFCGMAAVLPLESNGLRVLIRTGYAEEDDNYTAMYRSVRTPIADQMRKDEDRLVNAHLLLRRHGQTICRRNEPLCEQCVVLKYCRYGNDQMKAAYGN